MFTHATVRDSARDADLLRRLQRATTFAEIADQLGVSRERIRQRVVRLQRSGQPLPEWVATPRVRGRALYRNPDALIAVARVCRSATEFGRQTGRSRVAWACLEASGRLPALRRLWRWRQTLRPPRTAVWTPHTIIAAVRRFVRAHGGRMPLQKEFASTPYLPSHPVVYRHFGSMSALADATGGAPTLHDAPTGRVSPIRVAPRSNSARAPTPTPAATTSAARGRNAMRRARNPSPHYCAACTSPSLATMVDPRCRNARSA